MSDDVQLDEFLECESAADSDVSETNHHEQELRATFAWSPTAVACAQCGAMTERRWRDGDRMVCSACVEW